MAEISIPAPDAAGYWHFTYVTTDTLDGRWYGGKRSTKKHPLSDRYLGSGNWIKRHPARKRLKREIVAFHASSEDVFVAEAEMVTLDDVLNNPFCMNECGGGEGMTAEFAKIRSSRPEFRANHDATSRRLATDLAWRAAHAAGIARRASDPKWRENTIAARRLAAIDPDFRAKITAANRRKAADPEWCEAQSVAGLRISADPKWRENYAAGMARRAADPKWRGKQSAAAFSREAAKRAAKAVSS